MDYIPIEFEITGAYALFSDPVTRPGGEKCSYQVPTYEALKGVCKSIYWKPTISYEIEEVRIMNKIQFFSKGVRVPKYSGEGSDLADYMYLSKVRYQVKARMVWNENRPDFAHDRNWKKHNAMWEKALKKGGRYDVFLGTRECQADAHPCKYGSDSGYYDNVDLQFGMMLHGIIYPDEGYDEETRTHMTICYWKPEMVNGVIRFVKPQDCQYKNQVKKMSAKEFPQKEDTDYELYK